MKLLELFNGKTEPGDLVWLYNRNDTQFRALYGKALTVVSVARGTVTVKDPDGKPHELPQNKITKHKQG